jgi:Na+/H+ antiporter NhaD/arsenite permease-like protein
VTPAVLSLLALVVALVVSMTSRINVGWLAITFAWLIGVYGAGMRPDAVMAGFPVSLFLTLTGVTLLFAIAETNGTLGALAARVIRLARGDATLIPLFVFLLACALSSIGPGAISTVALLAPLAMTMGERVRVPPLLTALMVANGANAGNLSPFSSVGVIANGAMARAGLVGHEGVVWFANFAAHLIVGGAAYVWLIRGVEVRSGEAATAASAEPSFAPTSRQRVTLVVVAGWIFGVLVLDVSLGLSAFAASALLLVLNAADEAAAIRGMPWGIIMMVSGVTVLVAVLEKSGGMDLFTGLLATLASPASVNGAIAFVTGAISAYSSTSGVVLPAFLPTVPRLAASVGGGDPLAIALSINVGSSLVDVSPLSTLGALCVAAVTEPAASRRLFQALLAWGLSMTVVGALLCQMFAGWLARF